MSAIRRCRAKSTQPRSRAAPTQQIRVPGEDVAALLIARLAKTVLEINSELGEIDARVADRFHAHHHAPLLAGMVGIGDQLGAQFLAATLISIQRCPASKAFYDRKRADGKRHSQAVLALARRPVNALWAMLRDQQPYLDRPVRAENPVTVSEQHVPGCPTSTSPSRREPA